MTHVSINIRFSRMYWEGKVEIHLEEADVITAMAFLVVRC